MSTKIQINSLQALERLIGGDSELEIEVRASVVHAFTDKHLRGLVREMTNNGMAEAITNTLRGEVFDQVSVPNGSWSTKIEQRLKPALAEAVSKLIYDMTNKQISELASKAQQEIEAQVNEKFNVYTQHILKNLEPRIADQIITDKVRQKLASL